MKRDEPVIDCPCSRCGRPMRVDKWLIDLAREWNAMCRRRHEKPLEKDDLVMCEACMASLAQPPHEQQALFEKDKP